MPRPARRTAVLLALSAAALGLLVLAPMASADLLSPESRGGSGNATRIDTLYWIVFGVGTIVFLGVEGALLYSVFKYRARRGAVAAQIHGNTTLEISWTIGAAVILVILAIVTFAFLGPIRNPPDSDPNGYAGPGFGLVTAEANSVISPRTGATYPPHGKALNIQVNGQQYIWRFSYPDGDRNPLNDAVSYETMTVPTNTTVTLDITAQDVAHSWWIPDLGGKFDAVPGYTNHTWFKIEQPGFYRGQCAELCGRNHANMVATVRAIPPQAYARWLAQQKRQLTQSAVQAQAARRKLGVAPIP